MKPRILVVGSSNTDMIIRLEHIPKPGETILGGEFLTAAGGKGANQAVAAARAGGTVTFVARVGRDLLGQAAIAGFRREGINIKFVRQDPVRPSGVALIFVARNGENSIAVAAGANGALGPGDVAMAQAALRNACILLMQLETPLATVQAAACLAQRNKVRVILNPAPARPLPDALLRYISILTPNETEAEMLSGIKVTSDARAAHTARKLRQRGIETVIITLGPAGAFVSGPGLETRVPGLAVKAVDTTAAGDVFNGALAVALGDGRPLLEAVRFANVAAAISVTRIGAQPSAPKRSEIEAWAKRLKR